MIRFCKVYEHLLKTFVIKEAIKLGVRGKKQKRTYRKMFQQIPTEEGLIDFFREKLQKQEFMHLPIREAKIIYDGSSRKQRFIMVPTPYEQIIHHILMYVLADHMKKHLYEYCVGSIPGRGIKKGKDYLERMIKKNPELKYCLKMDIKKFFQNVDVTILKEKFKNFYNDKRLLNLIFTILDTNKATYNGETMDMGLPIGFYTSQWFSNFFLRDFDFFLKHKLKVKVYVRYVDDLVILDFSKERLYEIQKEVVNFLEKEKLQIKDTWRIFEVNEKQAIDFMGFKFYSNRTCLRKSLLKRATRKGKKLLQGKLNSYTAAQFMSYKGWFDHSNCYQYRKKYIPVDYAKLRQLISKMAKRKTEKLKQLLQKKTDGQNNSLKEKEEK